MRRAAAAALRTSAIVLVTMALCPLSAAPAAPPDVTIASPLNGSVSRQTPSFSGLAQEGGGVLTLDIYGGPTAKGTAIQEAKTALFVAGTWSLGPIEPLKDGTYTAQAAQTNAASETGTSSPVTFTIDTAAPAVTLNSPASPSSNTTPSFSGTATDTTPVIVQIHEGATTTGTLVSRATATGTGEGWSSDDASPSLASGEYTAVATQESSLGNPAGRSAPVTFTIIPPSVITAAVLPPPVASFRWFPPVPETGEPVSLISSSTDLASPITGIAWALTSSGAFQGGGTVLTTSFSAPGAHVVRLRVTDARGLSSVAAETIEVVGPTASLMQPFPIVRIAGTYNAFGAKLTLLKVQQLPVGARITVRCKGHGCPIRSASRRSVSKKRGVAPVEFRALERYLRAGITLEILVSKPGRIGEYTRFAIRRGKLPERVDMCLDPAGTKPLVCPSS